MSLWAKKTFAIYHLLVFEAAKIKKILLFAQCSICCQLSLNSDVFEAKTTVTALFIQKKISFQPFIMIGCQNMKFSVCVSHCPVLVLGIVETEVEKRFNLLWFWCFLAIPSYSRNWIYIISVNARLRLLLPKPRKMLVICKAAAGGHLHKS